MSSFTSETPEITPRQTMQGHTNWVNDVVHLHGGCHIITCSTDGSLRLWDLESGAQIGEDWQDDEDKTGVRSMELSPNGKTVASGCDDGKVRLWNVETREVVAKWTGHTDLVGALCWSADGSRVASGSWDGTARVWDVKNGETILTIETGHQWVNTVIYSPDATKIAMGGRNEDAVKIWNTKPVKLLSTLKHNHPVWTLAWTSDGKKLISGSYGPIRMFDTTTWEEVAIPEGHTTHINAITLSQNNRLLASASYGGTTRLWNLDTNLPVEPLFQHENALWCAAFSADGKLLVTGCENKNAYTWDIYAILNEAGLEDLLQPSPDVAAQESLMDADATQAEDDDLSPGFFNDSSRKCGNHHRSSSRRHRSLAPSLGSASVLFGRLWSPFRRSHRNTDDTTELQQRPRRTIFSRGLRIVEVAAVRDREVLYVAPPPPQKTQQQNQSHGQGSSTTQPAPATDPTTPRPRHAHSLPVRLLAHLVLFLCCAPPQRANGNAQQQGQPQGQAQGQASSSQTQPAAPSTSTTPPAPAPSTTASGAAAVQLRLLPLRARFVLFLCCASPPRADSH
ncbi:WD40-repeat-containing domain protein [Suillus americanus]|nr:WD40-repeat-containing domain protein [Suillus americanus]